VNSFTNCWVLSIFFLGSLAFAKESAFKSHRFDDDVSILEKTEPWVGSLKNIQLVPDFSLDVGGDLRISREWYTDPDLGTSTNQSQGYWASRYALHANLKGPAGYRVFAQLKYSDVEGKNGNSARLDNDYGDVQQIFIDKTWTPSAENNFFARVGRQEALIGSGRFVSVRDGPNSRLSFDAARLAFGFHQKKAELFVARPVLIQEGSFDNEPDKENLFVSLYGSGLYGDAGFAVDAYLMFFEELEVEERYALGTRFLTKSDFFKSNTDLVLQTGTFGDQDILAYGLASDMSLQTAFPALAAILKVSFFSGDGANGSDKHSTFNAFYPRGTYYGWSAQIGHPNLMAFQPGVEYGLRENLKLTSDFGFYWRQSLSDSIYRGNGSPIAIPAQKVKDRYIGAQLNMQLEWTVTSLLVTSFEFSHFFEELGVAELEDSEFVAARVLFKF
jgi:hypothetical protein